MISIFFKKYWVICKIACLCGMMLLFMLNNISIQSADKKSLFKNKCCSCHKNGGEAMAISPSINAIKQWKRFFKKNKHKRKYKDISAIVSKEESDEILSYLILHAADSKKPQAFGLR